MTPSRGPVRRPRRPTRTTGRDGDEDGHVRADAGGGGGGRAGGGGRGRPPRGLPPVGRGSPMAGPVRWSATTAPRPSFATTAPRRSCETIASPRASDRAGPSHPHAPPVIVRDHRTPPVVRDHRTPPVVRDHRTRCVGAGVRQRRSSRLNRNPLDFKHDVVARAVVKLGCLSPEFAGDKSGEHQGDDCLGHLAWRITTAVADRQRRRTEGRTGS